jgi:hypothetical protein
MKNVRLSVSATILGVLMLVASGCTSTMKVATTPGTEFTGNYRSKSASLNVSGNGSAVYELSGSRLEECEFRKNDPQQELRLIVHHGLFTGSLTAPSGSTGVRAKRDGMGYRMEIVP